MLPTNSAEEPLKLGRLARYRMSDVLEFVQGLVKEVGIQSC